MAASGRNSVTTPLCVCSVVAILLLLLALVDVSAAAESAVSQQQRQETGVVGNYPKRSIHSSPAIDSIVSKVVRRIDRLSPGLTESVNLELCLVKSKR